MAKAKRNVKGQSQRWPTFLRRVNVLIRRADRREVLTFLLFVLISAFFWTVQTSREETAQDYNVNLIVTDQPQDVVFTTHVPSRFKVTLKDTNTRLFNYRLSNPFDSLTVDFERYADAVGNFRISAAELQSLLRTKLKGSTEIVSVSPSLIDARFAQTQGRRFPVQLTTHYRVAENYRMHPLRIEPDSVIINAPESVLDTMRYVYVSPSSIQELLRDTIQEDLRLDLPIGVKATPSRVHIMVPVSQYVEKVFDRIVVRSIHVPEQKQLVVFPYAVQLSCLVDFPYYRDLTEDMFQAEVDYDSIPTQADQLHLPISIRYVGPDPERVSHIRITPQIAEYVIEQL